MPIVAYRPLISRLQEEFAERLNPSNRKLRGSDQTSFDQSFIKRHRTANCVSDWIELSRELEKELIESIPSAEANEAIILLLRSESPTVANAALENPSDAVKELARQHLKEFTEAGDPFSQAILEGREIP